MSSKKSSGISITEELDFHYLLELMRPMHNVPEYAWLPELFTIIGHEKLITLCKYAGGETIKIPTVDELLESIDSLQWFYDVEIEKTKKKEDVPKSILSLFEKISRLYHAQNDQGTTEEY